jgi:hypothetical protein
VLLLETSAPPQNVATLWQRGSRGYRVNAADRLASWRWPRYEHNMHVMCTDCIIAAGVAALRGRVASHEKLPASTPTALTHNAPTARCCAVSILRPERLRRTLAPARRLAAAPVRLLRDMQSTFNRREHKLTEIACVTLIILDLIVRLAQLTCLGI